MSKLSLRDRIASAEDIDVETIEVPRWGVTLEVRGMTGKSRSVFTELFASEDGTIDYEAMYPSLLIATCFDPETKEQVFTQDDAAMLNSKSGKALEDLAQVAMRLSGLGKQAENDLGKSSSKKAPSAASTSP